MQVALSIFMEVSVKFESFQMLLSAVTDSGYSQEDLVSNLVGFYIGIGLIQKEEAIRLCHPVSKETALEIWDREGAVGENKNREWTPRYATNTGRYTKTQCIDECILSEVGFPSEFSSIKPARKGHLYRDAI
ncbi:hypothetical protein [Vibrio nereis]|uniref:hypothetical protein n=1 Tax=Vibrio nereis TaxID=693 RepID=UPI0024959811|nr:hypothetical protein [Vibrio nereis]